MLHLGSEELVPDLHLHDGPAQGGHGTLDVQAPTLKGEVGAFGLHPNESHLLFVVIHFFEQALIALFALLVDSQGKPVLVHVIVIWHREHYSECLIGSVEFPLEQVVSQHAHRPSGFGFALAEVAHFSLLWTYSRLGGAAAVATFQENPLIFNSSKSEKKNESRRQNL